MNKEHREYFEKGMEYGYLRTELRDRLFSMTMDLCSIAINPLLLNPYRMKELESSLDSIFLCKQKLEEFHQKYFNIILPRDIEDVKQECLRLRKRINVYDNLRGLVDEIIQKHPEYSELLELKQQVTGQNP